MTVSIVLAFESMRLLWLHLLTVDLLKSVPEIGIPVYLMEGRYDEEAPSELAERHLDAIGTPHGIVRSSLRPT